MLEQNNNSESLENAQIENRLKLEEILNNLPAHPEITRLTEISSQQEKIHIPAPEEYSEDLLRILEIADEVAEISRNINPVELLTVDNIDEVKKKFMDDPSQNPVFTYNKSIAKTKQALGQNSDEIGQKLAELYPQVRAIKTKSGTIEQIAHFALSKIIRDNQNSLKLMNGLENGDENLVKSAIQGKYGAKLSQTTVDSAEKMYDALLASSEKKSQIKGGIIPQEDAQKIENIETENRFPSSAEGLSNLQKLRNENPVEAEFYFDANQIAEAFGWALDQYYQTYESEKGEAFPENKKYKISVTADASSIDVRDKSPDGRIIVIPQYRIVTLKKLLTLMDHEIECHARQSLNGEENKLGGGALKVDDEVWMEGLAISGEERFDREMLGKEVDCNERTICYIFAEQMANEGKNFVEVFEEIRQRVLNIAKSQGKEINEAEEIKAKEQAWMPAYRAFRGHLDTNNPNSFASLKDRAYFEGWLMSRQLEKSGLDYLNESVIPQEKALRLIARTDLTAEKLPFKNQNLVQRYYFEKLQTNINK